MISTSTTRVGLTIHATQTTARGTFDRERDPRDHDPRDAFVEGLELPRGLERELVQDERENLYELNREDSRMLATIGAFRVVAARDLEAARDPNSDPRDDTLDHLREEGLRRVRTRTRAGRCTDVRPAAGPPLALASI